MPDVPSDPRSIDVAAPLPAPSGFSQAVRPGRRRRRWPWFALGLAAVLGFGVGGLLATAWSTWGDVDKIDLASVMAGSENGTNYLIVGTDSREGVASDVENAGVIFGAGVSGERTDTIAVLRLADGSASLLAIPRDLYVPINGGASNRINAAFAFGGPASLVATVQQELGIGIDHYLEIDLAGFLGLVDALGGVTIEFANPAFDTNSGLRVETAGAVRLDAAQALAYVRSRHHVEIIDGVEVRDPTADLGRVQRQQKFLAAVFSELGSTWNPITLLDALGGVSGNVRVDDGLSLKGAADLGLAVRGADPTTATVPTTRFFTDSGADVLLLAPGADEVLAAFRG